jgi:cell division transport system permease protein
MRGTQRRKSGRARARQSAGAAERINGVDWPARLESYAFLHAHNLIASLGRLYRSPASLMTIGVIAIVLSFPISFGLVLKNAQQAIGGLEETNRMSVFLKPEISNENGQKLAGKWAQMPQIREARLITREAGLLEFEHYSGLGEALKSLDFNPLPVVVMIQPRDALSSRAEIQKLIAELSALPEVDFVQADMEWLVKLQTLLGIMQRTLITLGVLLSLSVLFVVGNTIRLELHHREHEILVTKLMGASNAFVRRPFLYAGLWFGLLGGLTALVLVGVLMVIIQVPVHQLAALFGHELTLKFVGFSEALLLLLLSVLIGILGAWIVVASHLRRLRLLGTS